MTFSFSYHSQTLFKLRTKSDDCLLLIPRNFKALKLRFNFLLHDTKNCLLILWQRFPALCVYFDQKYCTVFFCVWQKRLFLNFKNSFLLLILHQSTFLIPPWRPVYRFHVPMFHNKICCRNEKRQKRMNREQILCVGWTRERMKMRKCTWVNQTLAGISFQFRFQTWHEAKKAPQVHFNIHRLTAFDWTVEALLVCEMTSHFLLPSWTQLLWGNLITSPTKSRKNARNEFLWWKNAKRFLCFSANWIKVLKHKEQRIRCDTFGYCEEKKKKKHQKHINWIAVNETCWRTSTQWNIETCGGEFST